MRTCKYSNIENIRISKDNKNKISLGKKIQFSHEDSPNDVENFKNLKKLESITVIKILHVSRRILKVTPFLISLVGITQVFYKNDVRHNLSFEHLYTNVYLLRFIYLWKDYKKDVLTV